MKNYSINERARDIVIAAILLVIGAVFLFVVNGSPALVGLGAGFVAGAAARATTIRYKIKIDRWTSENIPEAGLSTDFVRTK
jgi:hypothetical protein